MRYVHTTVRKALADAVRKGLVVRNVADLASPPSAKAAKAPEASTWNVEQLRTFLEGVTDHEHFALFRTAGMTGMRRGELLGLRWSDIDLDGGTIQVRHQLGAEGQLAEVKTERSRRIVDLDPEPAAVLRQHRKDQAARRLLLGAGWADQDLVFTAVRREGSTAGPREQGLRRGRRPLGSASHPASRPAAQPASHLARAGAHPIVIQTQVGHSSVTFSQEVYTHVDRGRSRAAASAVGALMDAP